MFGELYNAATVLQRCGSTVTCKPIPEKADEDWLILTNGEANTQTVNDVLCKYGFMADGADYLPPDETDDGFTSWKPIEVPLHGRPREEWTSEAVEAFKRLMGLPFPRIAAENPIGCLSTRYRKPDQIIQPWMFGDDASKATCLWLKGLQKLWVDERNRRPGRMVEWPKGSGKMLERWSNQTDSGQNRLPPSEGRAALRSETYPGIARAFLQWIDALDSRSAA